ncbi:MAG: MOSC domain-containing protein [Cyanobacteria bacterium J069]|nr:MAG: MOSC domain-containing protein [Cyanobacteria bacterium J069]
MPYLSKILLYPIKSLDGMEVSQATVLPSGALAGDREFALVDEQGRWVNGKRTELIHAIRATYDLPARTVTLWVEGKIAPQIFHLDEARSRLETWFSEYFGYPVSLQQNLEMGFPDDTSTPGPTVISVASLETVAGWFPGMSLEECRQRFRANLEVSDAPAFWEDGLYDDGSAELVRVQIGEVTLLSHHPCKRCIVPTRHPQTGDRTPQFQQIFSDRRRTTLPANALVERFTPLYRLTLNTQVPSTEAGKTLAVGDQIQPSQFQPSQ